MKAERVSPLTIEMLSWFCTRANPEGFPNLDCPAQKDIITWMVQNDLIYYDREGSIVPKEKAKFWLNMICSTPLPQLRLIDPRTVANE